jgi:hypothetical protein
MAVGSDGCHQDATITRHLPVNITDVEDFAGTGADTSIAAVGKLDQDGHLAKVGTHREVGNGGGKDNGGGNVVEDALRARSGE